MWWLIFPGLLIAIVLFVLFVPIVIDLNSEEGCASIRFGRVAEAVLILNETTQVLRIRVGWWKKEIDLFRHSGAKREVVRKKPQRQRKKMEIGKLFRKMKGVLQSFRINRCTISIDTGDMPLNGILFPWFYLLRLRTGKNISISFTGETVVILQAENSIARMLWAYMKS